MARDTVEQAWHAVNFSGRYISRRCCIRRNFGHKMNSYGTLYTVLLPYGTTVNAYGKQYLLI
jgi:hypothetical protein